MLNRLIELLGDAVGSGRLSILIYHQVVEEHDPMRPTEPTAAVFEWHMQLVRAHYKPLALTDAITAIKNETLPGNAICVTFDDGYLNNLTVAAPILQKYQIPATAYVATGFSHGQNMWNDQIIHLFADTSKTQLSLEGRQILLGDWHRRSDLANSWLKKLKYLPLDKREAKVHDFYQENHKAQQTPLMMNPDQLRQLSEMGITIGAHTVNHPILKILPNDKQWFEINDCKACLESWLDCPVEHFAYPNGVIGKDLDETTVGLVRQAGFETAVVTDSGTSDKSTSPWLLKRFTPWDRSPTRFQLRLLKNMLGI